MASSEQTKWRGNQHLFCNVPAVIQDHARSLLDVPQAIWDMIVPKDSLSVTDLITFDFPPFADSAVPINFSLTATFFSAFTINNSQQDNSGELVRLIRKTIVPPKIVVEDLLGQFEQAWLDGAESICVPLSRELLPLWIVTYWGTLYDMKLAIDMWKKAHAWLKRSAFKAKLCRPSIAATRLCLKELSFSGSIPCGNTGGTNGYTKDRLLGFFGREWMSSIHIDLMLQNLEYDLQQKNLFKSKIIDTSLSWSLVNAYKNRIDGTPYDRNARGALQKLGADLQNDKLFGGMYHTGNNHWVTAVVEMRGEERPQIVYGYPLGKTPDLDTVKALRWFLAQHRPDVAPVIEGTSSSEPATEVVNPSCSPQVVNLPCSPQVDGHSCGILSFNALAHYYLPDNNSLITASKPVECDLGRLAMFRRIVDVFHSINKKGVKRKQIEPPAPANGGRPRLDVLDKLTFEISSSITARKHQCIGEGCEKTWAPRTTARVLSHCKRCLKLTPALRQLASRECGEAAPGALVAASDAANKLLLPPTSGELGITPAHMFFGEMGRKQIAERLDFAIVKLFCVAGIPPSVADLTVWKDIFRIASPSYAPASRTTLNDSHIMGEQDRVRTMQLAHLKTQMNITCSFDGGTSRAGESFYTVHATTKARRVMLLEGQECTDVSHTGEWVAQYVLGVLDTIGRSRFCAVSSDNTGNARVGRQIICSVIKTMLNLPDPAHHLNNMIKDILKLPHFKETIGPLRGTLTFFSHSNSGRGALKKLRQAMHLGAGLESIGKTRFGSTIWSAISLRRSLVAIRELVSNGSVVVKDWNHLYQRNSPATLQFELTLNQLIAIGEGAAKAIKCLEALETNPADVYLFWLAVTAHMKCTLETAGLPDSVSAQVRGIVNSRWREFFVDGPSNAHRAAFYLNPTYVNSPIFGKPNSLAFSITIPGKAPPKVPEGVKNPATFIEIGRYLLSLAILEIEHGENPVFTAWKGKQRAFTNAYKSQFKAYSLHGHPFSAPLTQHQTPLSWWEALSEVPNASILAALAIKLYSAVPHSMADERSVSVVTFLNTGLRNRQKVDTLMAMTQIRSFYRGEIKSRAHAHPRPIVKFYDIQRVVRGIDEDEGESLSDADDADDGDEDWLGPPEVIKPCETFMIDDSDIDLNSTILKDFLADKPLVLKDGEVPDYLNVDEEEDGGAYELEDWA